MRIATREERLDYIKKFGDVIIESTAGSNIFPSVIMAQAILEGNAGISDLAKKFNNHFGVKASPKWKGLTVKMGTYENNSKGVRYWEPNALWRRYVTALDSIKDHNAFLKAVRYAKVHLAKTPEQQATEIRKAGYATDPLYASKIMGIIDAYNLTDLDKKKSPQS